MKEEKIREWLKKLEKDYWSIEKDSDITQKEISELERAIWVLKKVLGY